MAFWGTEVKPGKPYTHSFDRVRGRLHISQATLAIGTSTNKSLVQCNVGDKSPVLLCALLPDKTESLQLDLEFEETEDVVFSVIGPRGVHLTGYYVGGCRNSKFQDDTESYGEDINTDTEESNRCIDEDEDEYEDSFINDDEPEALTPSPASSDGDMESQGNKTFGKKGSRRAWSLKEEEILVNLLKDMNTTFWKPDGKNFKTGYQKHIEIELQKKIPGVDIKASPHIDSKLKTWKKQYQTITTMVGLSGFTFNHTLHMIVNDEEDVWEKYLKEDPNAKEIRRKSFSFYNDWCEIWGDDRATGEFAETPTDAALGAQQYGFDINAAHPHDLDAPVGGGDDIDTPKPGAAPKKRATPEPRKRRRLNDEIREMSKSLKEGSCAMTEVAKHFASMVTKMSHDRDKRQELDDLVQPLGLSMGEHVRVIGLFSAKSHLLDAFLGFKNDEARREMVKLILDGTLV